MTASSSRSKRSRLAVESRLRFSTPCVMHRIQPICASTRRSRLPAGSALPALVLLTQLETAGLFKLAMGPPASNAPPAAVPGRRVVASSIRYAALCYGVPTKILRDEKLVEAAAEQLPAELRRNEASVDSQLACLP